MRQDFRQKKLAYQHWPLLDGVDGPSSPDGLGYVGIMLGLFSPDGRHYQSQIHCHSLQVGIRKNHFAEWPGAQMREVAMGDLDGFFGNNCPSQQQGFAICV